MIKNAAGSLASEDAMDSYCCKMNTEIFLKGLVADNKLDESMVTPSAIEQVLFLLLFNWCTISNSL